MGVGIAAVIFGIVMLEILKLYEMSKKDPPRPLVWLVVADIVAVSLYLTANYGRMPQRFV
jgi:hypothetical protein